MSQAPGLPVEFVTERGHSPPLCIQFNVFLDNRVGTLYRLVDIFDGQPIRLAALSVMEASDHAVVRLVTTRADQTRELLDEHHLPYTEAEILVVELGMDQRLTKLCLSLLAGELNIYYIYPLMVRPHSAAAMAIYTDNQFLAGELLTERGFRLVSEEALREAAGGDPPA